MKEQDDFKDMIDQVVEDKEDVKVSNVLSFTDPKWTEFIIENLSDDELSKGNPTTPGIRRVAQDLFGDIITSDSHVITDIREKATVKHTLVIQRYLDGREMTVSACVDVMYDKTPYPFKEHLVSTACTRAEGKALRRALKLNIQTAEELSNTDEDNVPDIDMESLINDQQILALKTMCRRLNVNMAKFIKVNVKKATNIKNIKSVECRLMMSQLSEFQRESVPSDLEGWSEGWEKEFGVNNAD